MQVSVYLTHKVLNKIKIRSDNRSGIIERDLLRLYELYREELVQHLYKVFSVEEYCVIVEAMRLADMQSSERIREIYKSVERRMTRRGLDYKWQVDGDALIEKLKMLSYSQKLAIVDTCDRFWYFRKRLDDMPMLEDNIKKLVAKHFYLDLPDAAR